MESLLSEKWDLQPKHSSTEVLQRWRDLCGVVKNPKRRFRFTANLSKRHEAAEMRKTNQQDIMKNPFLPSEAKLRGSLVANGKQELLWRPYLGVKASDYTIPKEVEAACFKICGKELKYIVQGRDLKRLQFHGGVNGIIDKLATDGGNGLSTADGEALSRRQEIYGNGITKLQKSSSWDYGKLLQLWDLDKKKRISIQVTRNGCREDLFVDELLPGDVVHLAFGDHVPDDGIFISGYSVLIEGSIGERVAVNDENPFLPSGAKLHDGICKMLVTTVARSETPLQVRLSAVTTIIGNVALAFVIVIVEGLVQRLIGRKWQAGATLAALSAYDKLELLEHVVMAAVPEGLPLAVALSLAFAVKKKISDGVKVPRRKFWQRGE